MLSFQKIKINIPQGTQAIFIAASPSAYTYFRIVDPKGDYKGYMMTGFRFPSIYFASESKSTLNAKKHLPMPGDYTLQMISLHEQQALPQGQVECFFDDEAEKKLMHYDSSVIGDKDLWPLEVFTPSEDLTNVKPRYYRGDLHAHTFLSDGILCGKGVAQQVNQAELDFIALTDHNVVPMTFHALDQLYIPSFELTLPSGHLNIHGLENPDIYKGILDMKEWSINHVLKSFLPSAHVVINHPFFSPWEFKMNDLDCSLVHGMEIICDPEYEGSHQATEKAISFLDFAWSKGSGIYAVGGSDSHADAYGDPVTQVYAVEKTTQGILKGLKNGHVIISRQVVLEMDYYAGDREILPGSTVENINDLTSIEFSVLAEKSMAIEANVIYNGKCLDTVVTHLKAGHSFSHHFSFSEFKEEDFPWIRLEVKNEKGEWIGFVNPVYQKKSDVPSWTWGELMEAYEKHEQSAEK